MASLLNMFKSPDGGGKVFRIYKRITTIGGSHENDICIQHPSVEETHAIIVYDDKNYTISAAGKKGITLINGEKIKSAQLKHQDNVTIGQINLVFDLYDELSGDGEKRRFAEIENYRKLYSFTEKLSGKHDIETLLNTLIDSIIEITNAANGFLILRKEDQGLNFTAARNLNRETISNADMYVSDSIISRVIETGKPIIVSDALSDQEFKTSASVLSLKLTSVMCVPIKESGELLGIIYVGNNNVVNLFSHDTLQALEIFAAQAALIIKNALLVRELQRDVEELSISIQSMRFGSLIGSCAGMMEIYKRIERIAAVDVPVLVLGETGTGKELVAREIHQKSNRKNGALVVVNCGAIPENLLESELFGHKKGAFTGALYDKIGKFKQADGGTLFLDEIGDMPLTLQVKILRAIEERVIVPIGGSKPENVDIRIVAATNKDLEKMIAEGTYREDLFYRLNVISLNLPPLRDRKEDVELIARFFLAKYTSEYKRPEIKGFSPSALSLMRRYRWPGNVRELENAVKKGVILCDKALVSPEDMGISEERRENLSIKPLAEAKEEWQREYILRALEANDQNRTKTAEILDVDPRTIFRYLEKVDADKKK